MRCKTAITIVVLVILVRIAIAQSIGSEPASPLRLQEIGHGRYYLEICGPDSRRAEPVEIGKRVAGLEIEHGVRFSMAPYERGGRICGYFLSPVGPLLSSSPATAGD